MRLDLELFILYYYFEFFFCFLPLPCAATWPWHDHHNNARHSTAQRTIWNPDATDIQLSSLNFSINLEISLGLWEAGLEGAPGQWWFGRGPHLLRRHAQQACCSSFQASSMSTLKYQPQCPRWMQPARATRQLSRGARKYFYSRLFCRLTPASPCLMFLGTLTPIILSQN